MIIKVCGMRQPQNIQELTTLQPDFIGLIFYKKSPRFVSGLSNDITAKIPSHIKKIGVFVNESLDNILRLAEKYNLNGIQLHGNETPEFCAEIKMKNLICIKAFNIETEHDFINTKKYEAVTDYFLFDTKTKAHGGSGEKFNWQILEQYAGNKPFLLSGGISCDDVQPIQNLKHPLLAGVDINSKFESVPGLKNIALVQNFITSLRKT